MIQRPCAPLGCGGCQARPRIRPDVRSSFLPMTSEDLNALSPAWVHLTESVITRGEGCYLYDAAGKRHLDFTSGIGVTGTGHCHPAVVRAIQEQASHLLFGQINCVIPAATVAFSKELRSVMPPGLDCFFFSNSGAEATEGAVKLARMATGRPNIIAFHGSFHGRTSLAMALTSSKTVYRAGYQPLPSGVYFAPFPYPYHLQMPSDAAVEYCIRELEHLLHSQTAPSETAAMLIEPVLGEGGYVPAPPAFLEGLRRICDEHGILLIIDEIQSGFGRTGQFWAHERASVRPDILVMAKCIASGMPMSAIAASRELMKKWPAGSHGGTYGGGNAVAMAAASATLKVIKDERLVENAREYGALLTSRLQYLQKKHPGIIGEVRGHGFMLATELRRDLPDSKKAASDITNKCAQAGLLLLTCGTRGNVIRWIPPLIAKQDQIEDAITIFDKALTGC